MPKKEKPKAVMVDGIPIKPISPAEHRRLDRRIKKTYEKLRALSEAEQNYERQRQAD